eukprot:c14041_g2_i1 orf=174-338(+)
MTAYCIIHGELYSLLIYEVRDVQAKIAVFYHSKGVCIHNVKILRKAATSITCYH